MRKYKNHFCEEPQIYNKENLAYEKWLGNLDDKEKAAEISEMEDKNYGKFNLFEGDYSIKSMVEEEELEISDHYRGTHNKNYSITWEKRDGHMIW